MPALSHCSEIVSDIPSGSILWILVEIHTHTHIYIYKYIYIYILRFFPPYTLTCFLAFYLASILTFFLAFNWHLCWHSILAFYLASFPTFCLASILAFYLAFLLTFSPHVGNAGPQPRPQSGSAHWDLEFAVGGRKEGRKEGGSKEGGSNSGKNLETPTCQASWGKTKKAKKQKRRKSKEAGFGPKSFSKSCPKETWHEQPSIVALYYSRNMMWILVATWWGLTTSPSPSQTTRIHCFPSPVIFSRAYYMNTPETMVQLGDLHLIGTM